MAPVNLLSLPAFLFSVFALYWSLPLMALTFAPLTFAKFSGPRKDAYVWSQFMKRFFGFKVLKYGANSLYKGPGNVLYLCNHRSWADFFIDLYLTEGRAALMSRWLVYFVFPVFMTSVKILKGIVLFKRGVIADKKKFNEWLDEQLAGSHVPGFLVYPEGHRSTKPESLPLKRGMMYYAHSRGMPVQLVISKGKEAVLSEKHKQARWGRTVVAGFSQVIESKDREFEDFYKEIQSSWDQLWKDVYSAPAKGLPELVHDSVLESDYPQDMRVQQALVAYGSIGIMAAVVSMSFKALLAVTSILGAMLQKVVVAGLVAWLGVSILASSA